MSAWSSQAPRADPYFLEDPWLRWICQRPDGNRYYQLLCEADSRHAGLDMPARLRQAGWSVPAVYGEGARFFTAWLAADQGPPAWPPGLPAGSLRVECGNPVFRYASAAASPFAAPRARVAPAGVPAWAAKRPVLAVVDSGLGFLHRQFRRAGQAQTRILAYWDQGAGPLKGGWHSPPEFGYGRELDGPAIDAAIKRLDQGVSEAQVYQDMTHPCGGWSHGHHVLALTGAQPHPLSGLEDAAGECPLIAVQVPDAAFACTQGQWLKVHLLDALHYILARAPADSALIVNVSLGAHSGRHDGDGALERAIDELVQAQGGRLTVVLAAGNSRTLGAHAQATLAPQARTEFGLQMESEDPSANFVELWVRSAQAGALIKATVQGPGGMPPASLEIRLEADPAAPAALWQVQPPGTAYETRSVAQFSVGRVGTGRLGGLEAQLLLCVAQTETGMGLDRPPSRPGRWSLALDNLGPQPVSVDAWVARDDDPGMVGDARRKPKPFTADTPGQCRTATLSDLAWTRSAIVVGGYRAVLGGSQAACMYEPSAAGPAPGDRPQGDQRTGPDLCAPALLLTPTGEQGVGDVNCRSDPGQDAPSPPWLTARQGTSLAAPQVCRRIALLLQEDPDVCGRDAVLQRLCARPGPLVSPAGEPEWTGAYWMPM